VTLVVCVAVWCPIIYCPMERFSTLLIFLLPTQASRPAEPAQALYQCYYVQYAEPDVVVMSSSDTKDALELLSLSPSRGMSSQPSGGYAQGPEANDMATSMYVALIAEPSSSHAPMSNAPWNE
jgi:hypothetical protein